ncbi:TB2/DP1, HVA22 family-domain-containing protein [Peziza echinospora]|nr:TB2/DP1, HVA22 family-domain-containing protein [Peziza echinospora]
MFDWLMRLASSSATFLFPVFASYKALKTNDPSQVTPWLMYWVVIACVLVVEAWTEWLLRWLPFYYNFRAAFMLWLVLPQTQGATKLYVEYVHPYLIEHEKEIENFIATAHDQIKAAGYSYLKRAICHAEEIILGTRRSQERPPTPSGQPYANFLLNRFKLSPIATQPTQTASDFYNSISSTLTSAIPAFTPTKTVEQEKAQYFALQQQKLRLAMLQLEQEMAAMRTPGGTPDQGFYKSPSGGSLSDFDHVESAEAEGAGQFWAGTQPRATVVA